MLVPTQTPPFLLEMEEKRKAAAEPVDETVVADAPAEPQDAAGEASTEVTPDPFAGKYVLDRANAYGSLVQLRETDPEFRQILDTYAGRAGKRKYEPELEAVKAELEQAKFQLRRNTYAAMSPQDIEEKFRTDHEFARDYTEAVHGKGVDVDGIREGLEAKRAIYAELDRAQDAGVPQQKLTQIEGWIQSGAFDSYEGRQLSPLESFSWYKGIVDQEIGAARIAQAQATQAARQPAEAAPEPRTETPSPAATAPAKQPKAATPAANLRLQEATPDLSQPNRAVGGGNRMTWEEYKALDVGTRMSMFKTQADLERAISSGQIVRST